MWRVELNLVNLLDVLQKVTEVNKLGRCLGVPRYKVDKIRQDLHDTDEQMIEVLQWWLDHAHNPTWGRVIAALRTMDKPDLADAVALVSKRESLYEPYEQELQKWEENLIKIESLDEKVREIQQLSEHLEKEWEKGEQVWCEYSKKLEKIEGGWEDLVKTQQSERAFLTLGFSLLFESDLALLHQYPMLEYKLKQTMDISKELREFLERAMEHHHGLQKVEAELSEWEKALVEQASELQKHINQMEELGKNFSGEAKDCRKRLEKSRKRLQACRKKMSECRDELTRSQRQLQKCQEKLAECEMNLKRCRDELDNNHSQITSCIEGLKKNSEKLSHDIQQLTIGAGTLAGAGTGVLVGLTFGPIGGILGAVVGSGLGAVSGSAIADVRERKLEETRKKLCECQRELNDRGNVVERCREVMMKSEEELKELQKLVSELEQTLE